MRPLCSSDRRRVSLVCRTQTEVWCTKPNRRRGLSPAVSVKNPISPAAFGLRWNSYFHHDLWVAPKKSSIFCIHLRPKVARPKISNFCVGSDGNIRAENVSGRMGTSAQKMAEAPTPVPTATRSSPRRSHEPTKPTVSLLPLIPVSGKP